MIFDFPDDRSQILRLDDFAQLNPGRPQVGELINGPDQNLIYLTKYLHLSPTWAFPVPWALSHTHTS